MFRRRDAILMEENSTSTGASTVLFVPLEIQAAAYSQTSSVCTQELNRKIYSRN